MANTKDSGCTSDGSQKLSSEDDWSSFSSTQQGKLQADEPHLEHRGGPEYSMQRRLDVADAGDSDHDGGSSRYLNGIDTPDQDPAASFSDSVGADEVYDPNWEGDKDGVTNIIDNCLLNTNPERNAEHVDGVGGAGGGVKSNGIIASSNNTSIKLYRDARDYTDYPAIRTTRRFVSFIQRRFVSFIQRDPKSFPETVTDIDTKDDDVDRDFNEYGGVHAILANQPLAGTPRSNDSHMSRTSADRRYIAFGSDASNLALGDTDEAGDVFVLDTYQGVTNRVRLNPSGAQVDEEKTDPISGTDGQHVVLAVTSTVVVENLSLSEVNSCRQQAIARSFSVGTNFMVADEFGSSFSTDGDNIATSSAGSTITVAETRIQSMITTASGKHPTISADGHHAAWDHKGSVHAGSCRSNAYLCVDRRRWFPE